MSTTTINNPTWKNIGTKITQLATKALQNLCLLYITAVKCLKLPSYTKFSWCGPRILLLWENRYYWLTCCYGNTVTMATREVCYNSAK